MCFLQCFDAVDWVSGRTSGLWKTEWWSTGMVIWLEWGANDLHMVQLMLLLPIISCFIKTQNGLPYWCWLIRVVLEKRLLNRYSSHVSTTISDYAKCLPMETLQCLDGGLYKERAWLQWHNLWQWTSSISIWHNLSQQLIQPHPIACYMTVGL